MKTELCYKVAVAGDVLNSGEFYYGIFIYWQQIQWDEESSIFVFFLEYWRVEFILFLVFLSSQGFISAQGTSWNLT